MSQKKWDSNDIPDQKDRVVIVTGSSSGIGYQAAKVLTEKNATMIIAVRNQQKGNDAADKIKADNPNADVKVMELDLASLKSVHSFATKFKDSYSRLDLLINNAGVMMPPYSKTADGFELQFGTNHLGHFALTGLLIDLIIGTPESRIVNVSSSGHHYGDLNFDDLNWENRPYKKMKSYGDSKLANIYFTYELQRRLDVNGSNTMVTASHPGWTATELQRHVGVLDFLNHIFAQDITMGALPTLYAAVGPDVKGGDYYGPSGWKEMKGYPKKVESNELSHDKEIAQKLWEVSEELTGIKYP
ncbi:MAG: SDR family NAD(P)-dependent oxidoreductase [Candidatus Aminicenantes bacterium]|nr:MAG: SDR family NAD(P)-dependent oxidoreductase [Candidatus Aminicenantes bacterium]